MSAVVSCEARRKGARLKAEKIAHTMHCAQCLFLRFSREELMSFANVREPLWAWSWRRSSRQITRRSKFLLRCAENVRRINLSAHFNSKMVFSAFFVNEIQLFFERCEPRGMGAPKGNPPASLSSRVGSGKMRLAQVGKYITVRCEKTIRS